MVKKNLYKKVLACSMILVLSVSFLSSCGDKSDNKTEESQAKETPEKVVQESGNEKNETSEKESEGTNYTLERKEVEGVEISKDSKWVKASGEVVENGNPLVLVEESDLSSSKKPLADTLFYDKEQWVQAVESTFVEEVIEKKDEFDEEFFGKYTMCYLADACSGNMQYIFEGATLEEKDGKNILTVYVSYSYERALNKIHNYLMFVTFDKEEVSKVDEIKFEKYDRD